MDSVDASPGGPSGPLPPLSESRRLRLFAVFLLYVAQGVPIGLFWFAIPAWMAANGASATDVASVLGLTALPWSLKFVNGFIMDRYTFLAMGRRRAWLIGAQLLLVLCLLGAAAIQPDVKDIWLLGVIGFIVNAATTFQDVAVDGLAIDIMEEDERSRASGMMFGGQTIGMAMATAATGAAIAAYGPGAAYMLAAVFIGIVTLFVIAARERPGERLLPWSEGQASPVNRAIQADRWWPIFKHTLIAILRPVSLFYLPILIIKGVQFGLLTGATPLIAAGSTGWAEDHITWITSIGQLVGGVVGMTLGGWLGDRIGSRNFSLLLFGLWLALNAGMALAAAWWVDDQFMTVFIVAWQTLDTLIAVSTLPIAMRLCNRTVAATQFTIYMALSNFGISWGAVLLGQAEAVGGIANLLGIVAAMDVIAILILLAVKFPLRQADPEVTEHLPQGHGITPEVS